MPRVNSFIKKILRYAILIHIGCASLIFPVGALSNIDYDPNSFLYTKQVLTSILEESEREFRVNNRISDSTIAQLRSVLGEAFVRLPDRGTMGAKNESLKRSAELYIDILQKNKSSTTDMQGAIAQVSRFLSEATIEQISATIEANPSTGAAPISTSFLAIAKDPSGINIPDKNYIWWMREGGGYKKELGRGPTLTYTFSKEGNYQIFLEVTSESRNKKGRIDVSPIIVSQEIQVRPRIGNIILLLNGVNISNLDTIKVSQNLGKVGFLFDATASRAVSNGTIIKTKWDFGNGNTKEYEGSPLLERQIYSNVGTYSPILEITTNQGQVFTKKIQLVVRDPSAVITVDKESGFIGDIFQMSAKSYLINSSNVEYTWEIQELGSGKKIFTSKAGNVLSYQFDKLGKYLVTLTTSLPNGEKDSDSRIISIESRAPIINLSTPIPLSPEKPNLLFFDARKSIDPDSANAKNLSFEWEIDGEKIKLNTTEENESAGTVTFKEKGSHTVGLTVSNTYGKVSKTSRVFDVNSTLAVGMNINPRATQLGNKVIFQARSPEARFFEWDPGDGSPSINGTSDSIEHIYKKTGIYNARLTVKNLDGSEENTINRKVYITDSDSPYALIELKDLSGNVREESGACGQELGAFMVNRSSNTTIDGSNSINVDGNATDLSYTWRFLDRIKTGPSLSEKFSELGCFPIELTVKSNKTGASHTSTRYIEIKNITPKVPSITASIDGTKKDTQKIIVNVTANGASDEDGVITSYIWFYTTESDQERQNIRITQSPQTAFVLPNVTEKYYFGVIVEDNDGARYDVTENANTMAPLIIANENANINMPLISLNISTTLSLVDKPIVFSATAKNILGTDITNKSEYYWDFDGDGKIDEKTNSPQTQYQYKKSGKYNMRLKVINNGTSNTKHQVITVRNELKASVLGYTLGNMTHLFNTSQGVYDVVRWSVGGMESTSLYGMSIPTDLIASSGSIGSLKVSYGTSEVSEFEILPIHIETIAKDPNGLNIQTSPKIQDGNTITLSSPGESLLISMHGNAGKYYIIDTDTKIDSNLDAIGDNDIDNKDTPSYTDGSVYALTNLKDSKVYSREMQVTVLGDTGEIIGTRKINVVLSYLQKSENEGLGDTSGSGSEKFSLSDKANLTQLQDMIRGLNPEDRIIFTQLYNNLIDNWGDLHDRTEGLLALQEQVITSKTLTEKEKTAYSEIIDIILVGDAQNVNEVSVASHVIEGLISLENINRPAIIEKLEQIKAHPGKLSENKILGGEILDIIKDDPNISSGNKILIKSQLLTIINGGQENIPKGEVDALIKESDKAAGLLGFISGTVKIFFIVIGCILIILFLGYIFYRISRKDNDSGFSDFLIDSVAHTKGGSKSSKEMMSSESSPKSGIKDDSASIVMPASSVSPTIDTNPSDPLETIGVYKDTTPPVVEKDIPPPPIPSPSITETQNIPDWLKPISQNTYSTKDDSADILMTPTDSSIVFGNESNTVLPAIVGGVEDTPSDPLDILTPESRNENTEDASIDPLSAFSRGGDTTSEVSTSDEAGVGGEIPNEGPLSPGDTQSSDIAEIPSPEAEDTQTNTNDVPQNPTEEIIPDWLKPVEENAAPETEVKHIDLEEVVISNPPTEIVPPPNADLPEWLKNSLDAPKEGSSSQKSEKKPRASKKKPDTSPPVTPAQNIDIPDWLK